MQVCHVPDGCESLNVLTTYTSAVHTLHYQDDRCAYAAAQMAKVFDVIYLLLVYRTMQSGLHTL